MPPAMLNSLPSAATTNNATTATAASSLTSSSTTSVSTSSSSSIVSFSENNSGSANQPLTAPAAAAAAAAAATTPTTATAPTASNAANPAPPSQAATTSSSSRSSSRRRGAPTATGTASASHVLRTTSTAAASAAAGGSSGSNNNDTKSTSGGPPASPPRAAVSSSSNSNSAAAASGAHAAHPLQASNSNSSSSSSILIAPPPRVALGGGNASTSTAPESTGLVAAGGSSSNSAANNASNASTGGGGGGPASSSGGSSGKEPQQLSQPHHYVYAANSHHPPNHHHAHHPRQQQHHHHHHNHHHSISSAAAASASLSAAAASAQLVKEKDLRVAQLERELAVMEAEFTRALDKLSRAEAEAAAFWQAKHGRLQQQVGQQDAALRLLRAEVELREAERGELRSGWEEAQRSGAARERAALERAERALERAERAEEESRALRQQVRGLKEWVSTSTRAGGGALGVAMAATSDEVLGEHAARLANGLQNWVIVHFRRAKLDLDRADKASRDHLARLVPMYEDLCHSAKLQLLQSAVSRLLVDLVFEAYFVGLPPDEAAQLSQIESFLKTFAGSAEPVNQWRALTLAIVSKDAGNQLQAETTRVTDQVVAQANDVLDAITDAQRSEVRDQALRQLVTSAVELARLLVAQKAVFYVFMPPIVPHQQVLFDASTMEDIGGEEEDDDGLAQREIACVTFPGIIKRGDETGGHLQYTNVICKARVLCASE